MADHGVSNPRLPVAPLPVLRKRNIDPNKFGSCGKKVINSKGVEVLIGCEWFEREDGTTCPLREHFAKKFAGEEFAEYGPRLGGVRILKPAATGGGMREVAMNCHDFNAKKMEVEMRGGMVEWVADEGEEIVVKGSRQEKPGGPCESFVEKLTIPKHPRIDGSIRMVDASLESELRAIHEERENARKREAMGGYKTPEFQPVPEDKPADEPDKPKRR